MDEHRQLSPFCQLDYFADDVLDLLPDGGGAGAGAAVKPVPGEQVALTDTSPNETSGEKSTSSEHGQASQRPTAAPVPAEQRDVLRLGSFILCSLPPDLAAQLQEAAAADMPANCLVTAEQLAMQPLELEPPVNCTDHISAWAVGCSLEEPAAPPSAYAGYDAASSSAPEEGIGPEHTDPQLRCAVARLLAMDAEDACASSQAQPPALLTCLLGQPGQQSEGRRGAAGASGRGGTGQSLWEAAGEGGRAGNAGVRMFERQVARIQSNHRRYEELCRQQEAKEVAGCTFSPTINPLSRQLAGCGRAGTGGLGCASTRPSSAPHPGHKQLSAFDRARQEEARRNACMEIYDNQSAWIKKNKQRYEDVRRQQQAAELQECTFKPTIDTHSRAMLSSGVRYHPARLYSSLPATPVAAARGGVGLPAGGSKADIGSAAAGHSRPRTASADAPQANAGQAGGAVADSTSDLIELAAVCGSTEDTDTATPQADHAGGSNAAAAAPDLASAGPAGNSCAEVRELFPDGSSSCGSSPGNAQLPIQTQLLGASHQLLTTGAGPPLQHHRPLPAGGSGSGDRSVSACLRLHEHALDMQERQTLLKQELQQRELLQAQSASPRIKALPAFYKQQAGVTDDNAASSAVSPSTGRKLTSCVFGLGQKPAGQQQQSRQQQRLKQDAAQEQLFKGPEYWHRFGLDSEPDLGSFLQRQQCFLAQKNARLQEKRSAPLPAPAGLAPGTRKLLARMEQRQQQWVQGSQQQSDDGLAGAPHRHAGTVVGSPARPDSAASALVQGLAAMLLGGESREPGPRGEVCSSSRRGCRAGSRIGSCGSRSRQLAEEFTYRPKITAMGEAWPHRSPEQMHADWQLRQQWAEQRRQEAARAEEEACTFSPSALASYSAQYARVLPRVVPADPAAWGRQLAARDEAAAAAAALREQRALEQCSFQPRVNAGNKLDLSRAPQPGTSPAHTTASRAGVSAPAARGVGDGSGCQAGGRIVSGLVEPEDGCMPEGAGRVRRALLAVARPGSMAVDSTEAGPGSTAGAAYPATAATPAADPGQPATGAGERLSFESYLDRVRSEIAALQAAG